jgi:hypothetical protein
MADEDDYTRMWGGVFSVPRLNDTDGVYIIEDENLSRSQGCTDTSSALDRISYEEPNTDIVGAKANTNKKDTPRSRENMVGGGRSVLSDRDRIDAVSWDRRPLRSSNLYSPKSSKSSKSSKNIGGSISDYDRFYVDPELHTRAEKFGGLLSCEKSTEPPLLLIIMVLLVVYIIVARSEQRLKKCFAKTVAQLARGSIGS